jgi:hypothetical protein
MRCLGWPLLAAVLALLQVSCDECAGTPSCHVTPEVSVSGQFVVHPSGQPVPGVSVTFVRTAGVPFAHPDSMRAESDSKGYFVLRAPTLAAGFLVGQLRVIPPAPYDSFIMPNVVLAASTTRGNGAILGRLVVNPYLLLIGTVYDRVTRHPVAGVHVTMHRDSGGRLSADSMTFVSDEGGQFSWTPHFRSIGAVDATFVLDAPGYPRTFSVSRTIAPDFHETDMSFAALPLGWGLAYSAGTARRGSYAAVPGVRVEYQRVSGIQTLPAQTALPVDAQGSFPIAVVPQQEGSLVADIRILPPAPFPPETTRVTMHTSDDDVVQSLGFFRFGAQLYLTGTMQFADNHAIVPAGSVARLRHLTGVAITIPAIPGDTAAATDSIGNFAFQAAAADSGRARFDLVVELPAPFEWDTIPALVAPARYNDSSVALGVLTVRRRMQP